MSEDEADLPGSGIAVRYRARFDECGPDGLVRTSTFLRYAQDVAWVHSERLGFGREWYATRNLAWVVRAVELAILAPLPLGATIDLATAVTGFRRVWARRRSEGRLADGTLALWVHTDWVMTDALRGMPGRVPDEFGAAFSVPPGSFEPGRVPLPPTPPDAAILRTGVRPRDIDPMGHVNNAAYVDYLEEAMLAVGEASARAIAVVPRRIRIEYAAAAAPGAVLGGSAWRFDDADGGGHGWAWRLSDEADRELARGRIMAGGRDSA